MVTDAFRAVLEELTMPCKSYLQEKLRLNCCCEFPEKDSDNKEIQVGGKEDIRRMVAINNHQ